MPKISIQITLSDIEDNNKIHTILDLRRRLDGNDSLSRYNYIPISKIVILNILKNTKDTIIPRDIRKIIDRYYKKKNINKMSPDILDKCTNAYIRFMQDNFLIIPDENENYIKNRQKPGIFRRYVNSIFEKVGVEERSSFTISELVKITNIEKQRLLGILAELNKVKAVRLTRKTVKFLVSREDAQERLTQLYINKRRHSSH